MTRWLVVGAGAAGCVVAARLSESSTNEVVLLEAGPEHLERVGQPGSPVLDRPDRLVTGLDVIRRPGSAPEPYAAGFGLGGSSVVNPGVVVGDAVQEAAGHALPVGAVPPEEVGPVGRAVLMADPDASAVALVGRSERRVSVADAYLTPRVRERVEVITGASVRSLVIDGRHVIGAVTATGLVHLADRVVLCAGAVGTPAILLRSAVDTPGVGERLQDHAGVAIAFDLRHHVDPSSSTITVTVERPGRQIVVMDHLPRAGDMGAVIAGRLAITSEGRVTLPDPAGAAAIELNQLADAGDVDGLAAVATEAMALLRSLVDAGAIGDCYADEDGTPMSEIEHDEVALRRWLPDHLGGYHHLAGSCRPGVVVDDDGRLVGYDGIHLCDASVLPGVPNRNPYLTVVRQAEAMARRWSVSSRLD